MPEELLPVEAAPLPEVPEVGDQAAAVQQPAPVVISRPATQSVEPSTKPSKESSRKPQRKPSPKPSSSSTAQSPEASVEVREIAAEKAVDLVLKATGGGVVQGLERTSHGGYDAFAVRVLRHDGSVVTGFVERTSGVIFDWQVNQEAPAPSASSGSASGDDDDDDEYEDESESESESESDDD